MVNKKLAKKRPSVVTHVRDNACVNPVNSILKVHTYVTYALLHMRTRAISRDATGSQAPKKKSVNEKVIPYVRVKSYVQAKRCDRPQLRYHSIIHSII